MSAIVLAAGRSVRFGGDKRLASVNGMPMFLRVALKLKQVVADTVVVLGSNDTTHADLLSEHDIQAVLCPDAGLGMGHSLAYAITQRAGSTGWLIMPADMPFIQDATLRAVVAAGVDRGLAAPVFKGQRGHPVWFGHEYGVELMALTGDEGARSILKKAKTEGGLYLVEVDDPGCVMDVDRPRDMGSDVGGIQVS